MASLDKSSVFQLCTGSRAADSHLAWFLFTTDRVALAPMVLISNWARELVHSLRLALPRVSSCFLLAFFCSCAEFFEANDKDIQEASGAPFFWLWRRSGS
jgi:hypothetical protein